MNQVEKIPDHPARALDNVYAQFQSSPNITAAIQAAAVGVQYFEDLCYSYITSSRLDLARGWLLDQWGELVGEIRAGLTDEEYRTIIEAKVAAVTLNEESLGAIAEVYKIAMRPCAVEGEEIFPGQSDLYALRDLPISDALLPRVVSVMEIVRPAGKNLVLTEVTRGYFSFEGDPDTNGYSPEGFGGDLGRRLN